MGDAMMAEVLVAPGRAADGLADRRCGRCDQEPVGDLRAHPWADRRTAEHPPGPNSLRHFDQCLEAVAGLKVDLPTRIEIIALIDDYAFGFVLREAQDVVERATQGQSTIDAIADYMDSQIATGRFPSWSRSRARPQHTRGARARRPPDARQGPLRPRLDLLDGIALDLERRGLAMGSDPGARAPR